VAGQMRYRFHEVTKAFARERQATDVGEVDWAAALARVGASWLILARHAQDGLPCERHYLDDRADHGSPAAVHEQAISVAADRPLQWFEAERDALTTLIPACAEAGQVTLARGLAGCVADFYDLRGYYADWHRTTDAALAASRRAGDRAGEAAMLRGLGSCLLEFDDVGAALTTLRAACALAEEIGEPAGAAMARKHIGLVLGLTGRLDEAERELRAAADELRRTGIRPTESRTLTHLGFVMRQRGDAVGAIRTIRAALTIAQACGDLFAQACATRGLAGAQLDDGRTRDAERAARRAAALFERIGDPIGAAQSLRVLGEALACDPNRPDEAEYALASAAMIFRERGHAWGSALVELNLGELEVRRGAPGAAERLRQTLRFWTEEKIPLLQARTLVALAAAAEHDGDPSAGELLRTAYGIYEELKAPQAAELADRLGIRRDTTA
jgi:tetratricopeptide (TPR) repeat protein